MRTTMRTTLRSELALVALASLTPLATAQTVFQGDAAGVRLGEHFAVLPDIDGDGVNDLLAGDPGDDSQGADAGRVLLLSGADGSVLRQHFGENPGDRFGQEVSRAGQLDGDEVGDYLVSAPEWGPSKGAVYAFSGSSGATLLFMRGFHAGDQLGASIDRAGDVDGDGTDDVIVGAPGFDLMSPTRIDAGVVYAVSGASGLPLHTLEPELPFSAGLGFGQYVSWIGDVDGDGHDDLYGAGPNVDTDYPYGYVAIHAGADGALLRSQAGYDDGHGFANHVGNGIAATGDVTGDGIPDYAWGQSDWLSHSWGLTEGHSLRVFDGATHAAIAAYGFGTYNHSAIEGGLEHLIEPVALGDVDGDGLCDLAYASPEEELVRVVSGAGTHVIGILPAPTSGLGFGATIRGIDDVTGDGLRDVAIGIPGFDGPAGPDSGQIVVYSGLSCVPPSNYCISEKNSSGTWSFMAWSGSQSIAANDLVLMATGCPPNKLGLFFYGPAKVYSPIGDGNLCVGDGGLGLFRVQPVVMIDGAGVAATPLDLNALPASSGAGEILLGSTWNFQFWFRDPQGGAEGFNFSDGLEVSFCD